MPDLGNDVFLSSHTCLLDLESSSSHKPEQTSDKKRVTTLDATMPDLAQWFRYCIRQPGPSAT
eukprot:scaffold90288_cov52-Attheya_sp.AAC.3